MVTGSVEVARHVGQERHVVAELKPGDIFGEMSLIKNEPCSADVKALTPSIVLRMAKQHFLDLASTYPQFLADLAALSAKRTDALFELENALNAGGTLKLNSD